MLKMSMRFHGTRALLMHNGRLADPTNTFTRALKTLTSQRNKTEATHEEIKKVEWLAGLYTDRDNRPALTEDMVLGCGIKGAKSMKKGEAMKAAVLGAAPFFPLEFDGPLDLTELYETGRFCDYRGVVVQRARTMRARPRFDDWKLTVTLLVDEEAINPREVLAAYQYAGRLVGLGDFRPRFGRFEVELV